MIDEGKNNCSSTSRSGNNTNHHHRIRNGTPTQQQQQQQQVLPVVVVVDDDTTTTNISSTEKVIIVSNSPNNNNNNNKYIRRRSQRKRPLLLKLQYGCKEIIQSYVTTRFTTCCCWYTQRRYNSPQLSSSSSLQYNSINHKSSSSSTSSSNSNHYYYNSNNNNNNNNKMHIFILCLFGIILLLLSVIAFLVVVLLLLNESSSSSYVSLFGNNNRNSSGSPIIMMSSASSSSTTTNSEKEYQQNFGNLVIQQQQQQQRLQKDSHHSLIDTPIYSKNTASISSPGIIEHNGMKSDQQQQQPDTTTTVIKNDNENNKNELQIVWLMSFPNSGTSYTSRLVRDVTQTFTASNYADETPEGLLGIRIPIYKNETYGPFWTIPAANIHEYTYPTKYVLTKTHCGIRCSLCSPNEYAESTYSFRRRCLVTKWVDISIDNTTTTTTTTTTTAKRRSMNIYSTYPITHVAKAIHLVRNPFDNVVSRFHLEHAIPNGTAKSYTPNRHGFLRYCLSIDYKYIEQEIKYLHFQENKLLQDLWLVPCHADFMKYIEWHNLAFITTSDLNLPTYILHYDWYSTRYKNVTTELFHFLQLPIVAQPPSFVPNKVYDNYYTIQEKLIVKRAFEFMASSTTWNHIQHYFPSDPTS